MIQKFYEYKLSNENYIKYFYLVLKDEEETFKSLVDGEFEGLQGISDSEKIINSFFDIRNLMLIMDKDKVKNLNEIEKVKYDDVDYLTKDTFKVMGRLTGNILEGKVNISHLLYQGFRKHEYKKRSDMNDNLFKLDKMIHKSEYYYIFKYLDDNCYEIFENIKKVKDFNDLVNQTHDSLLKHDKDFPKYKIEKILEYLILSYAAIFKKEGEWLVMSKSFKVPENSIILIKSTHPSSYKVKLMSEIKTKYLETLKEKYKVKILPYIPGSIINNTHKQAFPIIRYLDKLKNFESFNY